MCQVYRGGIGILQFFLVVCRQNKNNRAYSHIHRLHLQGMTTTSERKSQIAIGQTVKLNSSLSSFPHISLLRNKLYTIYVLCR